MDCSGLGDIARMMSYCLGLGFAMGLGHEKQKWRKKI